MPYWVSLRKSKCFCFAALFLLWFATPNTCNALNFGKTLSVPKRVRAIVRPPISKSFKRLLARVTVYWPGEDRWSRKHKSSTGVRLHRGVVAVDPRVIPYGSRIHFPDKVCTAVDTGSAVKTRKAARRLGRTLEEKTAVVIDRFFESKYEALAWARVHPPFMALDISPPE